jgi:hypothetical protein
VLLNLLIGTFCLTVGLRVVGCCQVGLDTELLEEASHNARRELRSSVTDELERETMEAEDFMVVDVGDSLCVDVGCAGDGVDELAVVVREDNDGVIAIGFW